MSKHSINGGEGGRELQIKKFKDQKFKLKIQGVSAKCRKDFILNLSIFQPFNNLNFFQNYTVTIVDYKFVIIFPKKLSFSAMTKTLNDMIEEHCRKGLSPAQIFKKMKGFVSLSGVYKAVKRFKETGNCSPRVRAHRRDPYEPKI